MCAMGDYVRSLDWFVIIVPFLLFLWVYEARDESSCV